MTNTGAWLCLVLAVVLASCRGPGVSNACGRDCVEGERCDVGLGKCVKNEAPVIRIDLPMADAVVAGEKFDLVGVVTDDEGQWENGRYSLDDGATWSDLGVNAGGDFDQSIPVPLVDGKAVKVKLEVSDAAGNIGRAELPLFFDRVAPRCKVLSPAADALVGGTTLPLTIEVLDDSQRWGTAQVSLDNAQTWTNGTVTAGQVMLVATLPQGVERSQAFTFRAEDSAGNRCQVEGSVRIDTAGPTLTEVKPMANAVIAKQDGGTYGIEFAVSDTNAIASVEVKVPPTPSFQPATLDAGVARFTWTLPAADDGVMRTVELRATDAVGNVTTSSLPVTVDVLPPICALSAPTTGQRFTSASASVTNIQWSVTDGSARYGTADVSTDDGQSWTEVGIAANGAAEFAWAFDPTWDGVTRVVRVRGRDAAGNRCVDRSASVRLDFVGPTLAVTTPAVDGILSSATASLQGTVTDGSGTVTSVTVDFDDGQGPRSASSGSGLWSLVVSNPSTEDYVPHQVVVRAVDGASNETTQSFRVYVDRVAPRLTVPSPTEGQLLGPAQLDMASRTPVQVQALDGDSNVTVEAFGPSSTWGPVAGGVYLVPSTASDDGASYTQQVRATDRGGNASTVSRTWRVDRVAPTIVSTSPADGGLSSGNVFAVQFSEPVQVSGTGVPFTLTPTTGAAVSALDGTQRVLTVSNLLGGTRYASSLISSRIADLAGNVLTGSLNLAFTTRPAHPANGAVVIDTSATQKVEWFRASTDKDGVIALLVRVINPTTSERSWLLGWVNPTTGLWQLQDVLPANEEGASLISYVDVVNGAPRRRASAWLGMGGTGAMFTLGTPGSVTGSSLFAPQLASQFEVGGSDYGNFQPNTIAQDYVRAPNPAVQFYSGALPAVGLFSGDSWGVLRVTGSPGMANGRIEEVRHDCSGQYAPGQCIMFMSGAFSDLSFDCTSGPTCVYRCSPSYSKYVRTQSAGYHFAALCSTTNLPEGFVVRSITDAAPGSGGTAMGNDPMVSYGAAATGTGNEVLVTWNPSGSATSVSFGTASPSTSLSGLAAFRTITVEPLQSFNPASVYAGSTYVMEPVPGLKPGVLYVAAPGKLMYRE